MLSVGRRTHSLIQRLRTGRRSVSTLGIRREEKGKWERRAPLTPEAVSELVKHTRVLVQPCNKRVFSVDEYQKAGAKISEDLSEADVILGIKEVPVKSLLPNKKYMFFSHTHKAQKHNMPMLKAVLDKNISLMDYELLVNDQGQRLVAFGKHAGYSGMINILHGLGLRLLNLGYGTPFLNVPRTFNFRLLDHARRQIQDVGERIASSGLPKEFAPMFFTFTGNGNVSQGAQEVFRWLPHEFLTISQLESQYKNLSNKKVYGVVADPADYIRDKNGKFELADYFKNGSTKYQSVFHDRILPYTSVFVNGAYWDDRYPALMTNDQLSKLSEDQKLRLLAVADISCDISGPLEFMDHASTIDDPFFFYDPTTRKQHKKMDGPGFIVCSIDNLPAELPFEATSHFSKCLTPLVKDLIAGKPNDVLSGAVIADGGGLSDRHAHLKKLTDVARVPSKKRVLLLGSGRVAAPLVDFFLRQPDTLITIASNSEAEAKLLARGRGNCSTSPLDVGDSASLSKLVSNHDITISFVPAFLHPQVAKVCIDAKRNMLTASYKSPELEALSKQAESAGITILNELGLDPGIDHLLALEFIDKVKASNGKITGFVSCCGGLPAPENSSNPLGYKFSWSPRGVLTASMNPAQYLIDGHMVNIGPGKILDVAKETSVYKGFNFEVLPNRDSMKYVDVYGLDRTALQTMFRGTLRYKGFSEVMRIFRDLGMLDADKPAKGSTWNAYMKAIFETSQPREALIKHLADHTPDAKQRVTAAFEWLGMFSDQSLANNKTSLDALCALLEARLKYEIDERDMVCLFHQFDITKRDGQLEKHTISMVEYGEVGGYSAMAKTVALPAAIGADLILTGQVATPGVLVPTSADIYQPVLEQLKAEGLKFQYSQQVL